MTTLDKPVSSILNSENELARHGVKGMKWGVRKDRYNQAKQFYEKFDQLKTSDGRVVEVHNAKSLVSLSAPARAFLSAKSLDKTLTNKDDMHNLVIKVDGQRVGDAMMYTNKKDPNDLYLHWLGVDEKHRGKGYATTVFEAAAEHGKKSGYKTATLEVPSNAPDARHIYEKFGFKQSGPTIGDAETDLAYGGLTPMSIDFSQYKSKSLKHSDDSDDLEKALLQTFSLPETYEKSDTLAHYGVKGMKWGKRRSGKSASSILSVGKSHVSNRAKAKKVNDDMKKMSDQELQQRINRLRNEEAYRQLVGVKPASKTVTGQLKKQAVDNVKNALTGSVKSAAGAAVGVGAAYVAKELLTPTLTTAAAAYTIKKNLNV